MINNRRLKTLFLSLLFALFLAQDGWCDNIDPDNDGSKYAYGENVGWLHFGTRDGNVIVTDANFTGYVWAENIGWVNLDPCYGGVVNDGTGLLSGHAWGENVGWVNFNPQVPGDPSHYGVTVNTEGDFDGWAYGENIGWIHFRATIPVAYKVRTSWITNCAVDLEDFAEFSIDWLETGIGLHADLDDDDDVDLQDLAILASNWLCLCDPGWQL